jgi:hypothetical protein
MFETRCVVCNGPAKVAYDPTQFHANPPPTCSPECKAKRKQIIQQMASELWGTP